MVSLISLFNAGGRFFWASGSDYIGRRNTYMVFFVVQVILFLLIPGLALRGEWAIFEAALFVVFTMYGGGFATIPAFLADMFGAENVGAIHGVILTAWSAAAIVGPVIITELSNRAKAGLAPGASGFTFTISRCRCWRRCWRLVLRSRFWCGRCGAPAEIVTSPSGSCDRK